MVLEALTGAAEEEIIADYMLSYSNYYGIEPGTDKYDTIVEKNIIPMLGILLRTDAPEGADLAERTELYLTENGMEKDAIDSLKAKLIS